MTPATLMFPGSWALNQRFSYLQQAPRSCNGKRKQERKMNTTTSLDNSILRRYSPLFWFTLVIPVAIIVIGINFILNPVGASTGYGIPIHDPAAFPFMWIKGIRDIFSGLVVLPSSGGETGAQPQHSSLFQFSSRSAMDLSFCDILALRRPSIFTGEQRCT